MESQENPIKESNIQISNIIKQENEKKKFIIQKIRYLKNTVLL